MKFIEWHGNIINVESIIRVKKTIKEFISREADYGVEIFLTEGNKIERYYDSKEELEAGYNTLRDILMEKGMSSNG